MRELDVILEIRRDINSVDIRLIEIRQMAYPKAQVISDMPRGGERKNAIEECIIKAERLESKKAHLQQKLEVAWREFWIKNAKAQIVSTETEMLRQRFYFGLPWKRVVCAMEKEFPNEKWDEQKLFRMYRRITKKIKEQNAQKG